MPMSFPPCTTGNHRIPEDYGNVSEVGGGGREEDEEEEEEKDEEELGQNRTRAGRDS